MTALKEQNRIPASPPVCCMLPSLDRTNHRLILTFLAYNRDARYHSIYLPSGFSLAMTSKR